MDAGPGHRPTCYTASPASPQRVTRTCASPQAGCALGGPRAQTGTLGSHSRELRDNDSFGWKREQPGRPGRGPGGAAWRLSASCFPVSTSGR